MQFLCPLSPSRFASRSHRLLDNEGCHEKREVTHGPMAAVTVGHSVDEILADLRGELAFPHKYGADTRSVLAEVGYSSAEIDTFAGAGVIA